MRRQPCLLPGDKIAPALLILLPLFPGETLSAGPSVAERQHSVSVARDSVLAELRRFEEAERRRDQLAERYAPAHLERLLEIAAPEAEEGSERLAERLSAGEIEVEAFVKQFMQQRTVSGGGGGWMGFVRLKEET